MRRQPSTPTMANPMYWVVFAMPKSTTHKMPLAAGDIGRSICANESM